MIFPEDVWVLVKEFMLDDPTYLFDIIGSSEYFPKKYLPGHFPMKLSIYFQLKTQFKEYYSRWIKKEMDNLEETLIEFQMMDQDMPAYFRQQTRNKNEKIKYILLQYASMSYKDLSIEPLWKMIESHNYCNNRSCLPTYIFLKQILTQRLVKHNQYGDFVFQGYIQSNEIQSNVLIQHVERILKPGRVIVPSETECREIRFYLFSERNSGTVHFQSNGNETLEPDIPFVYHSTYELEYTERYETLLKSFCSLYDVYPKPFLSGHYHRYQQKCFTANEQCIRKVSH